MKKIKNIFKRSLSTRLSLWVVFFAAIIFTAVFSLMFTETREVIREEAWGKATQTLDGTVMQTKAVTSLPTRITMATAYKQNKREQITTSTTVWTGI